MVDALGERLEAQRQQEIEELFAHDGSVAVANKITGTMLDTPNARMRNREMLV